MLKQIWTNLLGLQQLGQQGPPTQSVTGTIACKNSVCAHIKPDCLKSIASSVVQKPSTHGIWSSASCIPMNGLMTIPQCGKLHSCFDHGTCGFPTILDGSHPQPRGQIGMRFQEQIHDLKSNHQQCGGCQDR